MIRVGCAFRAGLMPWLWQHPESYDVFEHSLDAFVGAGSDGLRAAATCAGMGEYTLHCIGLSLGSESITERGQFLDEISAVLKIMEATEFSDHLSFCRVDDIRMHDFAALWRVEEQLDLFVRNVDFVQHRLGVQLSVENVATLFDLPGEIRPAEFANEVSRRTGCALLLDISNVLINESNGFGDAAAEFDELDLGAVTQVHLAGGEMVDGRTWDAHSHPVPSADLVWLERLLPRLTNCTSIIVERDERLQDGQELIDDLMSVREVVERVTTQAVSALP
ncbi:MAG TPA: DUF692 family protein [Acidimicrobiales bacterium]|nr:DUF692 family protein [Acidimicrobiales bacterium]